MTTAPSTIVPERRGSDRLGPGRERAGPRDPSNFENVGAVEIVAPDGYCAAMLLDHATPLFAAELVPCPGWIVRFHPPPTGRGWVAKLLSLVERWLAAAPLPCAKILQGEHTYLVRAPITTTQNPSDHGNWLAETGSANGRP